MYVLCMLSLGVVHPFLKVSEAAIINCLQKSIMTQVKATNNIFYKNKIVIMRNVNVKTQLLKFLIFQRELSFHPLVEKHLSEFI